MPRAQPPPVKPSPSSLLSAIVLAVGSGLAAACASAATSAPEAPADTHVTVRPGAPGEATRPASPGDAVAVEPGVTEADVRFMQGMIVHHAQALVMTDLARERTGSEDLLSAVRRITVSQVDEIELMAGWLRERGMDVPDPPVEYRPGIAHHYDHHPRMPGMLDDDQMERLEGARGEEFDRLFLELMIQHHRGALVMVDELFGAGGGQEGIIYEFASSVDADQRAEIARMRHMLEQRGSP